MMYFMTGLFYLVFLVTRSAPATNTVLQPQTRSFWSWANVLFENKGEKISFLDTKFGMPKTQITVVSFQIAGNHISGKLVWMSQERTCFSKMSVKTMGATMLRIYKKRLEQLSIHYFIWCLQTWSMHLHTIHIQLNRHQTILHTFLNFFLNLTLSDVPHLYKQLPKCIIFIRFV